MNTQNLVERLKDRDAEAFRELMQTYGKTLYPKLLSRLGSKELADEAFRRTMLRFYDTLTSTNGKDPIEILLLSCADMAEHELLTASMNEVLDELSGNARTVRRAPVPMQLAEKATEPEVIEVPEPTPEIKEPPELESEPKKAKPKPKKKSEPILPLILLAILAIALAWVVAGELMHTGLLPLVDLGYENFRAFCVQNISALKLNVG